MPAASAGQDVARRLMDDGYVVVTAAPGAGRSCSCCALMSGPGRPGRTGR